MPLASHGQQRIYGKISRHWKPRAPALRWPELVLYQLRSPEGTVRWICALIGFYFSSCFLNSAVTFEVWCGKQVGWLSEAWAAAVAAVPLYFPGSSVWCWGLAPVSRVNALYLVAHGLIFDAQTASLNKWKRCTWCKRRWRTRKCSKDFHASLLNFQVWLQQNFLNLLLVSCLNPVTSGLKIGGCV